jgi:hypothetical protein
VLADIDSLRLSLAEPNQALHSVVRGATADESTLTSGDVP